jgi:hypothetical protein
MNGRVFGLLLLAVACKETPTGGGSPDAGSRSSLAGTWVGVQSVDPNGPGNLAKLQLDTAPSGQVSGLLQISEGDANDLGSIGTLAGPGQGGNFSRGPLLPDGGVEARYVLTVTPSSSLNHVDMVEQHKDLDGGSFPVYYRFDRQ